MPNLDGTGPNGAGPMTGRGMGPCGEGQAGYAFGRGRGRGMGRGMGRGRCYNARPYQPTKSEYIKDLQDEVAGLQDEIKRLESDK